MNVEIINIGDELLIGQVVNTNASWMAEQLNLEGFRVHQVTIISDEREHILEALTLAAQRAEIILISGGIGPTRDDITKHTLCEYFNTRLVFNEEAFRDIETLFPPHRYPMTESNRQQAALPESCIPIPNRHGTARGMWFETPERGTIYVSMPGVPFEMKAMMTNAVIPKLKDRFSPGVICHKTILTQGVGESFLAEKIAAWETALPANIRLAYLPQPGIVRLRLTGTGTDEPTVNKQISHEVETLASLISEYIFGYDDDTLEAIVGRLLTGKKLTLATAESCTGGAIAQMITAVAGSSAYFKGSVVAYANDVKEKLLGVEPASIEEHGAVSEAVVTAMALGAQKQMGADYVIATSGIAGPEGGTAGKPVGTTWIAIASPGAVFARHFMLGDNRERNIRRTSLQALNMLRKIL
jgi:nicotinamide-nucleotide amidase